MDENKYTSIRITKVLKDSMTKFRIKHGYKNIYKVVDEAFKNLKKIQK